MNFAWYGTFRNAHRTNYLPVSQSSFVSVLLFVPHTLPCMFLCLKCIWDLKLTLNKEETHPCTDKFLLQFLHTLPWSVVSHKTKMFELTYLYYSLTVYLCFCERLTLCPVSAHQTLRSSCSSRPFLQAARRSRTPAEQTLRSQSRVPWCLCWLWNTQK